MAYPGLKTVLTARRVSCQVCGARHGIELLISGCIRLAGSLLGRSPPSLYLLLLSPSLTSPLFSLLHSLYYYYITYLPPSRLSSLISHPLPVSSHFYLFLLSIIILFPFRSLLVFLFYTHPSLFFFLFLCFHFSPFRLSIVPCLISFIALSFPLVCCFPLFPSIILLLLSFHSSFNISIPLFLLSSPSLFLPPIICLFLSSFQFASPSFPSTPSPLYPFLFLPSIIPLNLFPLLVHLYLSL